MTGIPASRTGRAADRAPAAGRVPHLIDGQRLGSADAPTLPVFNPTTGRQTGWVPCAGDETIAAAVASAERAFREWGSWSPLRRARVLFRFRELAEARADELARLISEEHGKVLADARGEVQRGPRSWSSPAGSRT